MPLHPIAVVDQVLKECRGSIATEFRARDESLRRTPLEFYRKIGEKIQVNLVCIAGLDNPTPTKSRLRGELTGRMMHVFVIQGRKASYADR